MTGTDIDTTTKRRRRALSKDGIASIGKLEAARQALTLVSELPDIVGLIDNAEAVRAAAKARHISAPGVNAWTRFVVDAERAAWGRVEAMRAAGELAKQGHHKNKNANLAFLGDLIDHRPNERAAEWSLLSRLTDAQLDAIEDAANAEDRLLTRTELVRLGRAGLPQPTKVSHDPPPRVRLAAIEGARVIIAEIEAETKRKHKLQVDDDAEVNTESRGSWVQAWIFVEDELVRNDLADD
jgi:hypothetical protein